MVEAKHCSSNWHLHRMFNPEHCCEEITPACVQLIFSSTQLVHVEHETKTAHFMFTHISCSHFTMKTTRAESDDTESITWASRINFNKLKIYATVWNMKRVCGICFRHILWGPHPNVIVRKVGKFFWRATKTFICNLVMCTKEPLTVPPLTSFNVFRRSRIGCQQQTYTHKKKIGEDIKNISFFLKKEKDRKL